MFSASNNYAQLTFSINGGLNIAVIKIDTTAFWQ